METKALLFEDLATIGASGRIQPTDETLQPGRLLRFEDLVRDQEPLTGLSVRASAGGEAEFWEAVSYLALWGCGWASVVLCFR